MDTNQTQPAPTQTTPPAQSDATSTPPAQNQQVGSGEEFWKAEAEKWKHFSRLHESNWEKATKELGKLNQPSGQADAQSAVTEAEERGRQAALASIAPERAQLKLEAAAARAGVDLTPVLPLLDTSKFLADGEVNESAINEFVAGFAGTAPKTPKFAQNIGIGPQSDSRVPGQLTRADLKGLSPREIAQARKDGRLDALMRGQL